MSVSEAHRISGVPLSCIVNLEHGRIARPQAHHLHKLAECYKIRYLDLMVTAGYVIKKGTNET